MKISEKAIAIGAKLTAVSTILFSTFAAAKDDAGWNVYNGDAAGTHYSALTQINAANVGQLKEAWRYDGPAGSLQTNPLIIGRTLYGYTTTQKVIALDAATGKELWTFDSGVVGKQPARGLTYWSAGSENRLFAGVMDHLYALDPSTGKPIPDFGDDGSIDLRKDLGNDYTKNATYLTSPGTLYGDLIIVGFRTAEAEPSAPGAIRAYDVRTGKLRWIFKTIPHPGEAGYETWPEDAWKTAGNANAWAGMVVDAKRGIVFAPTGSASGFYGYNRKGDNLYANTLLALDARTGKLLWHFQGVHHDLWDRDFASPPVLLTIQHNGHPVDVVAQETKQGFLFVLDRVTGKPIFPIEERPFPQSNVPGEFTSPTQPVPLLPAPYARQALTEDMLTQRTPEAHDWAVDKFKTLLGGGLFVPLSVDRQTIALPGFDGGGEWGGPAIDPKTNVIFINSNDLAWIGGLTAPRPSTGAGQAVYVSQCSACHGLDRKGSPPTFPDLTTVGKRLSADQVTSILATGRGRMPAFPALSGAKLADLVTYVRGGEKVVQPGERTTELTSVPSDSKLPPYIFTGYKEFLDPEGYPAIQPPWGTLNAIDLNTGKYVWKIPLGEYPALAALGMKDTGSENYGAPIVTASGLLIIGATIFDNKIRAFDSRNGKLLWEGELPYAGVATPATYMVDGRQYIVIGTSSGRAAIGGNRSGPQGSAYVAFVLPENKPLR